MIYAKEVESRWDFGSEVLYFLKRELKKEVKENGK
jgi:hypothetical protein